MSTRTFDDVMNELEDEGHLALAELVRAVAADATLRALQPDCSHLRLLLRTREPASTEIMVAHESAAKGGRRTAIDRNAPFEIVLRGDRGPKTSEVVIGLDATVERLRILLASQQG